MKIENEVTSKSSYRIPIKEKLILSIEEASALSGLAESHLKNLMREPDCEFRVMIGNRYKVKRQKLEKFINDAEYL